MTRTTERQRNVTLADVARYAGVSSAVVSYVVNDGPRPVAAETADRVRKAIAQLGYRPNSHARALSTGTTGVLGLIHPGTANPFFGEYSDVICEAAADADLALLTATSAGQPDTERALLESLARRSVAGIVSVTSMTRADVPNVRDPGLPVLFLNCPFPVPGYRTIGPDALDGASRIVGHLLDVHQHRQVAFVAGETGSPEPDDREVGWLQAHRSRGLECGSAVRTAFTADGGYDATQMLLTGAEPPHAIFVSSDQQALGALHAIHEQQLRVPEDVAVISFDGTSDTAHMFPPLTLARQPMRAMALAAVTDILGKTRPSHTLFKMDLVIRRSCGCEPDRPPRESTAAVRLTDANGPPDRAEQ